MALYRAGNWPAAVEALKKADALIEGEDGFHRAFLAMAHWQLGNREIARKYYAEGAAWIAARGKSDKGPIRFRSEAEDLMGIDVEDRKRLIEQYRDRVNAETAGETDTPRDEEKAKAVDAKAEDVAAKHERDDT